MPPTPDAELLERLRAAWNAAGTLATEPTDDRPPAARTQSSVDVAARSSRCGSHGDPTQWEDAAAPNRSGWIRTTCRTCGAFIGYRPTEGTSRQGRRKRVDDERHKG